MAQILQSQLQDLKRDIERLSAERDNIARYGLGAPWHDVRYQSTQANVEEPISVAAAQEASFEAVAKRAREKLEEQESQINSLKSELSRAQESLQSRITHQDDVFSVSHADERLLAGVSGKTLEAMPHVALISLTSALDRQRCRGRDLRSQTLMLGRIFSKKAYRDHRNLCDQ